MFFLINSEQRLCKSIKPRAIFYLLLLLSGTVFLCNLKAQTAISLTVDDGLSQGYVASISCDKDGFIWIGTLNGLNRFDGYSFQTWMEEENGLNSNYVAVVKADPRGLIWIHTHKGLQVMNVKTGRIFSVKATKDIRWGAFQAVFIDTKGRIWLSADNRLFYVTIPDEWSTLEDIANFSQLHSAGPSPFFGKITSITEFGEDVIVSTMNGLYTYHIEHDIYSFIKELPATGAYATWFDRTGGYLLARYEHELFALRNGIIASWPMDKPTFHHQYSFISNDQKLFIVNDSSIYEWKENRPVLLFKNIGEEIISAAADRLGQLWIGTNAKGLRIIRPPQHIFSTLMEGYSIGGALCDKKGRIWFPRHTGTGNTYYYLLDRKTGKLGRSLSDTPYRSVVFLQDGKVCGVNAKDELEFLREDGTAIPEKKISVPPGTFRNEQRSFGLLNKQNRLIMSDMGGILALFDPETKSIQSITYASVPHGTVLEVKRINEDQYGNVWIATADGLIRVTPSDSTVVKYSTKGPPGKTISSEKVNDAYTDPAEPDVLWAGTARGLNRIQISTGTVTSFTKKDGLNDDFIYTILAGKSGDLWLGTNHGLLCFNRITKQVVQYTIADGLPASEFNTGMAWTTPDSNLFYGTVNGLVYFNPFTMPARLTRPDVRIIGLEVNGKSLSTPDSVAGGTFISYLENLKLQPSDNNLAFRFTVMDFFNSEKYNCRFMLTGADHDWRYSWSNNLITYSNLAPGSYVFMVAASDGTGGWGPARTLNITILYPWWNRWWAWMLWLKLAALFTWIIVRVRKRLTQMGRQMELERLNARHRAEVEEHKTRMFLNIAHEVRTPLTILLGLTEEIDETARPEWKQKTGLMRQSGHQLLNVVQQILDLVKLEQRRLELNPQYGDLASFVPYVAEPFRPMLRSRDIDFRIYLPYRKVMTMFDPQYLQPVISNLLSNAAKFTAKGGIITLTLTLDLPNKIYLSVEDTGIGIAPEHLPRIFDRYYQVETSYSETSGTGIGLTYVSELVKAMGGDISVNSVVGVGSVFTIVLPIVHPEEEVSGQTWLMPATATPAQQENPVFSEQNTGNPQVLLVEDNYEMAQFISRSLSREYRIHHAINGVEGLEMARSIVPDLIITDVMMPEMSGFELCEAIKSDTITNHIPVVILTARADEEDRIQGLTRGADVYLGKPFSRDVLRLHVRNLIAARKRMQERWQKEADDMPVGVLEEAPKDEFVTALHHLIAEHHGNPDFGVDDMCRHFGMSNSQFHRKVGAMLGYTPGDALRKYRLEQGKRLLSAKERLNIAEIAYTIGFRDPNYFSQAFGKAYGKTPREYRKSFENDTKRAD